MTLTTPKILCALAAASALGACSSSAPTVDTTKNFDSAGSAKPNLVTRSITQTGLSAPTGATHASYDQPSDTLTIERTGTSDVTMVGSVAGNPNNADLQLFSVSGVENGVALLATTSSGDGYAVGYRNETPNLDPEASVIVGGAVSTAGTPSAIRDATFDGHYLGYAEQTLGGLTGVESSITGDVTLTVNSNGNGIDPGTLISNRQGGSLALQDVTTTGGVINGNLEFSAIPIATTGLIGQAASGTMDGAFFEASTANPDGEVVGAILLQGGNATCTAPGGDVSVLGASCVLETGVFVAD